MNNAEETRGLEYKRKIILESANIREFINSLPYITAILDDKRRVVFANQRLLNALGLERIEEAFGSKPGEIMHCVNAGKHINGCGAAAECKYCGCVMTILQALSTKSNTTGECRIISLINERHIAFEFRITASPIIISGDIFLVVSIQDISDEKQKERLERAFFHDIINTVGGIKGIVELIMEPDYKDDESLWHILEDNTNYLISEIEAHRDLIYAERKILGVHFVDINALSFLNEIVSLVRHYPQISADKSIVIKTDNSYLSFRSDYILAKRVVLNMLKNAFEATSKNHTINVGFYEESENLVVWVQNENIMTDEVKSQIFQRSFSTKGHSRGIGTYSMRLFMENYLQGKVFFESNQEKGTIFYAVFPK